MIRASSETQIVSKSRAGTSPYSRRLRRGAIGGRYISTRMSAVILVDQHRFALLD